MIEVWSYTKTEVRELASAQISDFLDNPDCVVWVDVGAILLGATLIAGIYGMNFEHVPELGWDLGYLWALGLMLSSP